MDVYHAWFFGMFALYFLTCLAIYLFERSDGREDVRKSLEAVWKWGIALTKVSWALGHSVGLPLSYRTSSSTEHYRYEGVKPYKHRVVATFIRNHLWRHV